MIERSGMTFIELMVVIFIIGLVTAITMPSFVNMLGSTKTGSAARQLAAYIKYMQDVAVRENRPLVLVLDKEDNKYWAAIEIPEEQMPPEYYYVPVYEREELRFPPYEDGEGILRPITFDLDLKIIKILDGNNNPMYSKTKYRLYINPDGTATRTTIHLEGPRQEYMTVYVKPYTGDPEVYDGAKTIWHNPEITEEEY